MDTFLKKDCKKRKIVTLDSFFVKRSANINNSSIDASTEFSVVCGAIGVTENPSPSSSAGISEHVLGSGETTLSSDRNEHLEEEIVSECDSEEINVNDIGNFIETRLKSSNRHFRLNEIWYPKDTFKFPSSGKRNLKFQYSWFRRWKWLSYSKKLNGAFCKYCVFFSADGAGVGHQPLGKLVKNAFSNWKAAVETFKKHENCEYHKNCIIQSENLRSIFENRQISVDLQLNKSLYKQIDENRQRIKSVIETVIFCGRQCLSLRGHRDSGKLNVDMEPEENDGNFRAILRLRVKCGDIDLKNHLETSSKNSTYISPRIQNEIIYACNDIMVRSIVARINSAEGFSVLADETADISGVEQFSLSVRYLDKNTTSIREDFLQFVPVSDLSGQSLARTLINTLQDLGVDCQFMFGQGYDGASAMSGRFEGVQAHVLEKHNLALYVHCASHCLNLAISDACSTPSIRNCLGTLGSVWAFFNTPKRQEVLKRSIENMPNKVSATRLKQLCPTRWVQRHESVVIYLELQNAVLDALEEISMWNDKATSSAAFQLMHAIKNVDFQTSIHVLAKVFAINLPLSRLLQTENSDLATAIDLAEDVEAILKKMRENAHDEFLLIFQDIVKVCESWDVNIAVSRRTKIQLHRCNVKSETPEEYFRISIFIPFLDSFIAQINMRLLKHKEILKSFKCLLPDKVTYFDNEFKNYAEVLAQKYEKVLNSGVSAVVEEVKLWWKQMSKLNQTPKNALDALLACNVEIYPNVWKLLQIFATLPVSIATSERSFSTLRRLKTYLRNTMNEERINGLAMLNIHRDIPISAEEVIDELAKVPRRLDFRLK